MLWDGFWRSLRSSGELWRPKLSSGGPGESSEARSSIHSSNLRGGAEAQELRLQGWPVVSVRVFPPQNT